jgi:polar amino acid transport system ATP-binding protein
MNAYRREVGMVFQHFNLFPHMTVLENLCLAQKVVRKRGKKEREAKAMALLEKVGIAQKANEFPHGCPAASSSAWRLPGRWRWTPR